MEPMEIEMARNNGNTPYYPYCHPVLMTLPPVISLPLLPVHQRPTVPFFSWVSCNDVLELTSEGNSLPWLNIDSCAILKFEDQAFGVKLPSNSEILEAEQRYKTF